jgi:hypothetical protein
METEGSLPYSQEPATCPYPERGDTKTNYFYLFISHQQKYENFSVILKT